jgi:hypothetical protein
MGGSPSVERRKAFAGPTEMPVEGADGQPARRHLALAQLRDMAQDQHEPGGVRVRSRVPRSADAQCSGSGCVLFIACCLRSEPLLSASRS